MTEHMSEEEILRKKLLFYRSAEQVFLQYEGNAYYHNYKYVDNFGNMINLNGLCQFAHLLFSEGNNVFYRALVKEIHSAVEDVYDDMYGNDVIGCYFPDNKIRLKFIREMILEIEQKLK